MDFSHKFLNYEFVTSFRSTITYNLANIIICDTFEMYDIVWRGHNYAKSIYTYKTWILYVCVSVRVFAFSEATKSPRVMKFWL